MATDAQKHLAALKKQQDAYIRELASNKKKSDFTKANANYQRLMGLANRSWNPIQNPIHFALMNGVATPGIGSFPALESAQKWDIQTGPGLSGGVPIYRGAILSEPVFVCRLYDVDDWNQLHILLPVLDNPTVGKRPQAIRILHPMLDLLSPPVRAVIRPKWILTEPDDLGVSTFTIHMIQYRKLTASQAKPEAAKAEPSKDPWDQLIERQSKQIQDLSPPVPQ